MPNVYNYQSFLETERAGYVIRQWLANNLYDRIRCDLNLRISLESVTNLLLPFASRYSTRPFLSSIEKKWIAFQLVNAMKEVKTKKVHTSPCLSIQLLTYDLVGLSR